MKINLIMLGVGFITGHLLNMGFRKKDPHKIDDIIMVIIGLLIIIGGMYYHRFFGW